MTGNDLRSDIAGAQRAGIRAVWVDHAREGVPESALAKPDRVVGAISELL
jgi:FMN phosphatase YigB (HAD superfamily)